MKILILLLLIYTTCFAQPESIRKVLNDDAIIGVWPDEPPQLIGGIDSLQSRLQYPVEALQNHIEGNIYIVVTIDSSGVPLNPTIVKGLGYGCEEEATRLVKTSKFLPATKNGKPVKSQIALPIKFRLPKEE